MPNIFFPSSNPRFIDKDEIISKIRRIATKIVRSNPKVDKIYLFGSFSSGNAGFYSDADILIVLKQDNRRMIDRSDEFLLKFSDAPVPVDILVYTIKELNNASKEDNAFIKMALSGEKLAG